MSQKRLFATLVRSRSMIRQAVSCPGLRPDSTQLTALIAQTKTTVSAGSMHLHIAARWLCAILKRFAE